MTDKELLQLAAKVSGIMIRGPATKWIAQGVTELDLLVWNDKGGDSVWNPLTDDGDALRLAVKLKLAIHHSFSVGSEGAFNVVTVWHPKQTSEEGVCIKFECDIYEATRRAIVRAAAEIGKGMK